MKNNKFGLAIFLSLITVFLLSCGTEQKENVKEDTVNSSSSPKKDVLKSLGLDNQNDVDTWNNPLSITVLQSSYMGGNSLEEKVLEADNVFIATVEDMQSSYSDSVYDENGKLLNSIVTTNFKLNVLENLRGELPINETVKALRIHFGFGDGLEKGNFVTLIESDVIPEKGKTYIFLARAVDGDLVILNGGEAPSNLPLENAPMELNQQPEEVVQEIIETSSKVEEIDMQVENEKAVFDEIGSKLLNSPEIKARIEGHGNEPDLNKVVVK